MGGVGDRQAAGEGPAAMAGDFPCAERHGDHLALADLDLDALADEPGVERVVVAVDAHVSVRRHPGAEPAVGVGPPLGQLSERPALLCEAVERPAAQCPLAAGVDLVAPAVELVLAVELVGEHPTGLEVRAQVAPTVLDQPLGLAVARLENQAAHGKLAEQPGIGLGGAASAGVQRALAI